MKKQWVLVCVLAGALMGSNAAAQHKAPNQQPSTTEARGGHDRPATWRSAASVCRAA